MSLPSGQRFASSPDEEPTPAELEVHVPIGRTIATMRRQIWLALALNAVVLAGLVYTVYYQSVVLAAWRQTGRDLQLENRALLQELAARVRAHDGLFPARK